MTRRPTPQRPLLELILPHLDPQQRRVRVRRGETHVQSLCPFHDDHKASLSLTVKDDKTAGVLLPVWRSV
jgi:DNA primase